MTTKKNTETTENKKKAPLTAGYKDVAAYLKASGIEATKSTMVMLPPEELKLIKSKSHALYDPRVELDPDPDFVEDIRQNGVQKAIVVRLAGETEEGAPILEIVAGRQRTMASILINKELEKAGEEPRKVPVQIKKDIEISQLILLSISENWQRPESVMSKAVKVKKALDNGATKESIRLALRCAPNTVDDLLKFLELSTEVQTAIEEGRLPLGTIKTFAEVPAQDQAKVLTQVKAQGATKTHEIKAVVGAAKSGQKANLPETKKVLSRRKMEQWAAMLAENHKEGSNWDSEQAQVAFKMLSFLLGYRTSLRGMPDLWKAAEACGIAVREGEEDRPMSEVNATEF